MGSAFTPSVVGAFSARAISGDTSGTAVPAGYIGQVIRLAADPGQYTVTGSVADVTGATLALSSGVWHIVANPRVVIYKGTVSQGVNCYVQLTLSDNTILEQSTTFLYGETSLQIQTAQHQAISSVVSISTPTVYKLRGYLSVTTNGATGYILPLTYFYAVRIA